jgi:NAD(P)-dependent dehydrogenase (short-subunit alcohol dehydrogenase family)
MKSLPAPDTPAKIITLTTAVAYDVVPALSAYAISKLAVFQLMSFVAAENPNIVAVALHPGIVDTDMTIDSFKKFALDKAELVGAVAVWLAGWNNPSRQFLSGRYVSANWDVEDLLRRKEEILEKNLLTMKINATLGAAQFQK